MYTHDTEGPRLLPYQVPRRTDPKPPLLDLIPNDAPFTRASFPRVHIPLSTLLRGIPAAQRNRVMANKNDVLALIPFGAGAMFFYKFWEADAEIDEFLTTLGLQTRDSLRIEMPETDLGQWIDDYEPPYAMFLYGANLDLRRFLIWYQTFDLSATLSFHAIELKENGGSEWPIVTLALTGSAHHLRGFTRTPGGKGPSSENIPAWFNPYPMAGRVDTDYDDPIGYYYDNQ
uniref:Uncharacterized protein n=1 Tax=Mycena chlorophos TaxID=658473 RepID=A0ABQ0LI72_MYCCL|nr:predicted protein [Mycena chlorophos]